MPDKMTGTVKGYCETNDLGSLPRRNRGAETSLINTIHKRGLEHGALSANALHADD